MKKIFGGNHSLGYFSGVASGHDGQIDHVVMEMEMETDLWKASPEYDA